MPKRIHPVRADDDKAAPKKKRSKHSRSSKRQMSDEEDIDANHNKKSTNHSADVTAIATAPTTYYNNDEVVQYLEDGTFQTMSKLAYSERMKTAKPRSDAWNSFSIIVSAMDKDVIRPAAKMMWVKCNICGELKRVKNSSTTNLNTHAEEHQKSNEEIADKQSNSTNAQLKKKKFKKGSISGFCYVDKVQWDRKDQVSIRNTVCKTLCLDKMPDRTINKRGMQLLLKEVYNLGAKYGARTKSIHGLTPSDGTIRLDIHQDAESKRLKIIENVIQKEMTQFLPALSLTADLWKEKHRKRAYLGMTIRWWREDPEDGILSLTLTTRGWKQTMDAIADEEFNDEANDDNHDSDENDYAESSDSDYSTSDESICKVQQISHEKELENILQSDRYRKTGKNVLDALLYICREWAITGHEDDVLDDAALTLEEREKYDDNQWKIRTIRKNINKTRAEKQLEPLPTVGMPSISIAHDLGSDILWAIKNSLFSGKKCYDHRLAKVLEWCIKDSRKQNKEIDITFHSVKKVAKSLRQSDNVDDMVVCIKNYCKTRWGTFTFLFETIYEAMEDIRIILNHKKKRKIIKYSLVNVVLILCFLLVVLQEINLFQNRSDPRIHQVIPSICGLEQVMKNDSICNEVYDTLWKEKRNKFAKQLNQNNKSKKNVSRAKSDWLRKIYTAEHKYDDNEPIKTMKENWLKQSKKRLWTAVDRDHWFSIMLFPFTRDMNFGKANLYNKYKNELREQYEAALDKFSLVEAKEDGDNDIDCENDVDCESDKESKGLSRLLALSDEYGGNFCVESGANERNENEFDKYFKIKFKLNATTFKEWNNNPMVYWEQCSFPVMRLIARNVFIKDPTSAPSESTFSDAKFIVSERRSGLSATSVDDRNFLSSYYQKLDS